MKQQNRFDLSRTACVVAGSEGLLGKACARALLDGGATVIGLDLKATGSKLGRRYKYHRLDLAGPFPVKELGAIMKRELKKAPKEIAFINVAYPRTSNWGTLGFENVTAQDFLNNAGMHLGSAFFFSQFAVSYLKRAKKTGSLINFGSIYSLNGPDLSIYDGTKMKNPAPYTAIKAGIIGTTKYVATAFGKHGIRANVLCPGGVFDNQPRPFVKAYERKTPLGRMARPEDIAGVCAFLASPAASYVTGQVIYADGGWTAW